MEHWLQGLHSTTNVLAELVSIRSGIQLAVQINDAEVETNSDSETAIILVENKHN